MAFSASTGRQGNVHLLTFSGEIDFFVEAELGAVLEDALRNAGSPLIVDLRDVRYMDSSGFRRLLRAHAAMTRRGDYFALVVSPGIVDRVLDILHFRAIMPIHDDLEAAVEAAKKAGETR